MIDLHMHINCSDGSDSVEEIIDNVKAAGVKYFSITDHDTARAAREILSREKLKNKIKENGLRFVTGCEFSCKYKGCDMHVLAYDFDPFAPEIIALEDEFAALLKGKAEFRFKHVTDNYKLSQKSIDYLLSKENVRKLDYAKCLIEEGYFSTPDEACIKFLNLKDYDGKGDLDAVEVISSLSKAGIKTVWAHALHGLNKPAISHEKVEQFVVELLPYGLSGLECYYSLYTKEENEGILKIAQKYDMLITCGSDYHGANKEAAMASLSCDGTVPDFDKISVSKLFGKYSV